MSDFGAEMKEKLLQEALQKRINKLTKDTIISFHSIFAEEFERYQISRIPGFTPSVKHFNDVFMFMQFIEALLLGYKMSTYYAIHATEDVMSDPFKLIQLMNNPKFKQFMAEFAAKTSRDIN